MRNDPYATPSAAELYFDQTIFGHLYTLFAETLGREAEKAPEVARDERSLLDRLDGWFWRQRQKDQESYLAGSRDLFELERRMDALEHGIYARAR